MTTSRPLCPVCGTKTKKNGTTTKGTTRYRCTNTNCGASTTRTRPDITTCATFHNFHRYATGPHTLTTLATSLGITRQTLNHRFATMWLIDVPTTTDSHRIYDQIFLDATYLAGGCLLIASTRTHVLAWHWAHRETTAAYTDLLQHLAPPLCAVLDGGQGAYSAIKKCWPTTTIQRCLVHAQRVVRRYTTTRPHTDAGRALYTLALKLTRITTTEQATTWVLHLHQFGQVHKKFLNEKTPLPPQRRTVTRQWEYTHLRVRTAYRSLVHLQKNGWLFAYLQPPNHALEPRWASTTNSLEGGINSPLKLHARIHRGLTPERQRRIVDWWLHSKKQLPDDPLEIARQCNFGQDQLAKVSVFTAQNENRADQETGRPALFDNAIPTEYTHSIGIRKAP